MEKLIKNISEYITINHSDIEIINKSFSKKEYKKGEFLLEQGKHADKVFFINENGDEVNTYFASAENFITLFSSFINQYSSVEFIKAEKKHLLIH